MPSITWLEPTIPDPTIPRWQRWTTECGQYRIETLGGSYTSYRLTTTSSRNANITERRWLMVASERNTLDEAMDAINQYYCAAYNLIPY